MFRVEIKTGGAAYRDDEDGENLDPHANEVRCNLLRIIDQLRSGSTEGNVFDSNGNKSGHWMYK